MKDYSNEENKISYILKYEIDTKNGIIRVKYADKEIVSVPLTQENYDRIVEKMDEQIESSCDLIKSSDTDSLIAYETTRNKLYVSTLAIGGVTGVSTAILSSHAPIIIGTLFGGITLTIATVYDILSIAKRNKKEALEKNFLYSLHKEQINALYLNNPAYKNKLDNLFGEKENYTIKTDYLDGTTLDKYTLKDLKKMRDILKRKTELNFDYSKKLTR